MTKQELKKHVEYIRLPVYELEKRLGMPSTTIGQVVKRYNKREFPKKWDAVLLDYVEKVRESRRLAKEKKLWKPTFDQCMALLPKEEKKVEKNIIIQELADMELEEKPFSFEGMF